MILGAQNDLAAINVSVFHAGMKINAGIYYKHQNNYVLICRNVVLTEALISKIRHFSSELRSIYVEKKAYHEVLQEGIRFRQEIDDKPFVDAFGKTVDPVELEKAIEVEEMYQSAASDTEFVLGQVSEKSLVPMELTDQVVTDLGKKLLQYDDATLLQCINSIRQGDQYLYSHCVDVAILNGLIGRWINLSPEEINALIRTGYLHDVGKISIPSRILNKPGPLTKAEYAVVKAHCNASYDILVASGERDSRVLEGAREHHERVNGTGYPDGIGLDKIPLFARITAVSDVYSAMVSQRVYKPQHSPFEILDEFARDRFSDLDCKVINIFLNNMPQELVGKSVLLSNGEPARVLYVPQRDFAHPIVETQKGVLATGKDVSCVSMSNPVSLFADQPVMLPETLL